MKDNIFDLIKRIKDMLDYYKLADDERRLELRIYKVRWIWYHTILAVGLGFVIYLLWEINNKLGGML
mgnify:FL=1|tara:strand:- start:279 stop:479 length:201 start_codon:yes stop_codon:yes gene_type:complete